jgi:hypothetical protein
MSLSERRQEPPGKAGKIVGEINFPNPKLESRKFCRGYGSYPP